VWHPFGDHTAYTLELITRSAYLRFGVGLPWLTVPVDKTGQTAVLNHLSDGSDITRNTGTSGCTGGGIVPHAPGVTKGASFLAFLVVLWHWRVWRMSRELGTAIQERACRS
jgi:hypothetical protein